MDIGINKEDRVEITNGLSGGEQVVVNPSDDVREDAQVKPTYAKQKAGGVGGNAGAQPNGVSNPPAAVQQTSGKK